MEKYSLQLIWSDDANAYIATSPEMPCKSFRTPLHLVENKAALNLCPPAAALSRTAVNSVSDCHAFSMRR